MISVRVSRFSISRRFCVSLALSTARAGAATNNVSSRRDFFIGLSLVRGGFFGVPGDVSMAAVKEETRSPLVRARGLTKSFAGRVAVDRIDFDIFPGEVVGFLGPNGAGKTTT